MLAERSPLSLELSLSENQYRLCFDMGDPESQAVSDGALEVRFPCWQSRCRWCELVYIMCEMVIMIDVQDVLAEETQVEKSQSGLQLSGSVDMEIMSTLEGILDSLNSLSLSELMYSQAHTASCFSRHAGEQIWWGGVRPKSKSGSKRGLCKTNLFLKINLRGHLIPKAPSKRSRSYRARRCNPNSCKSLNGVDSNKSTYKVTISMIDFTEDCKSILQHLVPMAPLKSLRLANDFTDLSIHELPEIHCWLLEEEHPVPAKKTRVDLSHELPIATNWDSLTDDMQDSILNRLEFKDLFCCKTVSKAWKKRIESDDFCQLRGATSSREGSFTAISYYIKNKTWNCIGYDLHSNSWRSLPPLSYLPAPDANLFKEYSVTGHRTLMCAQLSKLPNKGELVVFNPLTGKKRVLPPLLYPRNPVLVHISVHYAAKSYTVIVAGSSSAREEYLSKKVEVFHSTTSKWTEASDIPGPLFGLNEHQSGVCVNGVLHIIAFLDGNGRRGVAAFDVENGKWLEDMACAIPFATYSPTLQLIECEGKVHLFSEQERDGCVEHCIDVLEKSKVDGRAYLAWHWRNLVRVKKCGGRGLQVYPEYTCVSFGDGKLCVFNTLSRDGVVYDMRDGKQVSILAAPHGNEMGEKFFSLNPASFSLQPNFESDPMSSTSEAI
ncbi:hypothetical protein KC19_10G089300 [Ceratodon purpureus]|uniref:F-box domain-containing protein n=1 Tax=Ceratodon purpureus TaxID=3225 RepID=A0A8T0GJP8_CERPU|nr:hypothetical protein KC19_10G089300 [Ceratodon purpureus]